MSHYYLIGLWVATFLGWFSWGVVVHNLSPFISGYLALAFFYSSLLIALTSTFSIFIYYLRNFLFDHSNKLSSLNTSLRQGSLLALMLCIGLLFQRLRVLTWWDSALVLIIVILLEYYFSKENR